MKIKKTIFGISIFVLIILSIYYLFVNQLIAIITLVLLFLITFFKKEFYDLLKEIGL